MSKIKKHAKLKKMLNAKKLKVNPAPPLIENIEPLQDDFFKINHELKPPYNVILDTCFINFSIRRKLDIQTSMIRCLFGGVNLFVTDCVIRELETFGPKFRIAQMLAKDKPKRLRCDHKESFHADDCIVSRVDVHRCFLVATCDSELKSRIRKVPGVPIVYVRGHRYDVEKLPRAIVNDFR